MDALQRSQLETVETRLRGALEAVQALLASRPEQPVSDDTERFARCLSEVLKHEGGYVDHPKDPGGATNLGITHKTLADWRGTPVTKADVKALTRAEAAAIYRARYWKPAACDRLPAGLDLIVFDMAVNSGVTRAVKTLQEAVGAYPDGIIGPMTLQAVAAVPVPELLERYRARREAFYRGLKTFATFGRGWMRRLSEVTEKARAWA